MQGPRDKKVVPSRKSLGEWWGGVDRRRWGDVSKSEEAREEGGCTAGMGQKRRSTSAPWCPLCWHWHLRFTQQIQKISPPSTTQVPGRMSGHLFRWWQLQTAVAVLWELRGRARRCSGASPLWYRLGCNTASDRAWAPTQPAAVPKEGEFRPQAQQLLHLLVTKAGEASCAIFKVSLQWKLPKQAAG